MKDRYVACYLSGRMDTFDGTVDMAMLVAKIDSGAPMRDTVLSLARSLIGKEMDAATKVAWLKDNLDEIKSMGGDTEKAWRMFCEGRIDALVAQLDEAAMEELVSSSSSFEDDEEDDEEEGDEEGDDEDEEDDDDEEEED